MYNGVARAVHHFIRRSKTRRMSYQKLTVEGGEASLDGLSEPLLDGLSEPLLDGISEPSLDGIYEPLLDDISEPSFDGLGLSEPSLDNLSEPSLEYLFHLVEADTRAVNLAQTRLAQSHARLQEEMSRIEAAYSIVFDQ
ncbi:hypothetical protein LINGRAHAP2_LOCUS28651, partial [Linum grandiflorum]